MRILKLLKIVPLALVISGPLYAHHSDSYPRFDKRFDRQHERIKDGVRSGELTKEEAKKLKKQQKKIAALERKFSRDGYLSGSEKRKLEQKQDKASKRIRKLKNNDRFVGKQKVYRHHGSIKHGHKHRYDHKPIYGYDRRVYHNHKDNGWFLVFNLSDYF